MTFCKSRIGFPVGQFLFHVFTATKKADFTAVRTCVHSRSQELSYSSLIQVFKCSLIPGLVSPQAHEAAESSSLPFSRTSSYEKVQFHHSALKTNQPNKTPCNCKLFPPKSVDWAIFMCLVITLVLILFRTVCSD